MSPPRRSRTEPARPATECPYTGDVAFGRDNAVVGRRGFERGTSGTPQSGRRDLNPRPQRPERWDVESIVAAHSAEAQVRSEAFRLSAFGGCARRCGSAPSKGLRSMRSMSDLDGLVALEEDGVLAERHAGPTKRAASPKPAPVPLGAWGPVDGSLRPCVHRREIPSARVRLTTVRRPAQT